MLHFAHTVNLGVPYDSCNTLHYMHP